MEWINTNDRLPELEQFVLVFGKWHGEINGNNSHRTIGYVQWGNINYSTCPDTDAYAAWYSDITHWAEITLPTPPENE